ncbi:hypothetical protein BH23ACT12_BH23ACT12_00310 [soil metagenome]
MPDADSNLKADSGTDTPLHAYKQGSGDGLSEPHQEDVVGDPTGDDVANTPIEDRGDPGKP